MLHHERIGKAGPIERAVNLHGHNGLAISLDSLHDIQRHIDGEDFVIDPFFDRSNASNLTPRIVHDGIVSEAGLKRFSITVIDGPDVSLNGLWQSRFFFSSCSPISCWSFRSWGCFRRQ